LSKVVEATFHTVGLDKLTEEFLVTYQQGTGLLLVSVRFRWEVGAELVEESNRACEPVN